MTNHDTRATRRLIYAAAHLYALDEFLDALTIELRDADRWMTAVADQWITHHASTITWLLTHWPDTTPEDLVALVDANRAHSEPAVPVSPAQSIAA